jgi:hypothetical protein
MHQTRSSLTLGQHLHAVIASLRAQLAGIFNPYRPEQHYMRGPGPRWHARHHDLAASIAQIRRGAGR